MEPDVQGKIENFMRAMKIADDLHKEYLRALSVAKREAEELGALMDKSIKQPRIDIEDCELDN